MSRSGGEPPDGARLVAQVSHASLFSYLVTRQTGQAVRTSIEEQLASRTGPVVTVLDFRHVSVIDFSCADEVVAKLADSAVAREAPNAGEGCVRFFLFTGLDDHHLDPVESALQRRRLTVPAERADGTPCLLGELEETLVDVWERVARRGVLRPDALAAERGMRDARARDLLDDLHARRLVLRRGRDYLSLRRAVDARTGGDDHR